MTQQHPVGRRHVFGIAAALAVAACSHPSQGAPRTPPLRRTPPRPSAAAPGGPAVQRVRGDGRRPQVALTFHGAGDLAVTRRVLDVLAQHKAHVTVLAVGTWLHDNPDAAAMVRDGGHELGNHTWSHPSLSDLTADDMRAEIERCRDQIARCTGTAGAWFRPSQEQYATPAELAAAGRAGYPAVLSYDIDSLDWTYPGTDAIRRATATATAGSVVSMHLGNEGTLAALPGVLADLSARGLAAVTATELFR
jgi:peptidoglycan/xylan/chitin deacetylase (PgdA/CDA1 family)